MPEQIKILFYNQSMDRPAMKQLISRLVGYLGVTSVAHILDHLKTLGFHYATESGISLGIDDLLTAPSKSWLIQDAENQALISDIHNRYGSIHAVEKLRQLIETWYITSEYLKQEMNPNFRITDPLNPVHLMSFSGARGSTSQVHQLVGMRGLMTDPQGQIIDLPIQNNLREGLSLTEYIISCYGARKGVVDTAVRTSDAGYLTRRLVEVVQHAVIRQTDCQTTKGIHFKNINKKINIFNFSSGRLIGRVLGDHIHINNRCIAKRNQDISTELVMKLVNSKQESFFIRSPLTCKNRHWICQLCYGWSLNHGDLVQIGEAVGIIAGQSIGEPGTQLTLRTFHTGGVFTGDIAEHIRSPFNGIVHFDSLMVKPTRTRHGHPAWICDNNLTVIIDSPGKKKSVLIPAHSLILIQNGKYIKSKQLIAEVRAQTSPLKEQVEKYIYSSFEGEMHWGNKINHEPAYMHSSLHIVNKSSHVWILEGIIDFSWNNKLLFYKDEDQVINNLSLAIRKLGLSKKNKKILININAQKTLNWQNNIKNSIRIKKNLDNFSVKTIYSHLIIDKYKILSHLISEKNIYLNKNKIDGLINQSLIKFSMFFLKNNTLINNHQIIATFDPSEFQVQSCGIIKYGTIEVDNQTKYYLNSEENKNQSSKIFFKIIQSGTIFWIPEEVFFINKPLSLIFVEDCSIIKSNTEISEGIYNKQEGLVQIKRKSHNLYQVSILPGKIYYPSQLQDVLKKHGKLYQNNEHIIDNIFANQPIYIQYFNTHKGKSFLLFRPAIEYYIHNNKNINQPLFITTLGKQKQIQLETIKYILYENGEYIQSSNNIQLIQKAIVIQIKDQLNFQEVEYSKIDIGIKTIANCYFQISIKNKMKLKSYSYIQKIYQKPSSLFSNNFNYLNNFIPEFTIDTNLIAKSKGIIRSLPVNSKKEYSFLIISNVQKIQIIFSKNEFQNPMILSSSEKNKLSLKDNININYKNNPKVYSIKFLKSTQFKWNNIGLIGYNYKNINHNILDFINPKYLLYYLYKNQFDNQLSNKLSGINLNWFFIDESLHIHSDYVFDKLFQNNQSYHVNNRILNNLIIKLGQLIIKGCLINNNDLLPISGQIISITEKNLVFRLANPYLATKNAIIHGNYGQAMQEGNNLITLIYERFKSRDIIQGLPKVEQLLEARPLNTVSLNLDNGFLDWSTDMNSFLGEKWSFIISTQIALEQSQIELVDQIQRVYQSQGVNISDKHLEIIVRQMTSRVHMIQDNISNIFLPGEIIDLLRAQRINRILHQPLYYKPLLIGITKASLNTYSFISEASFQETTRVLTKAAIKGRSDWLRGLKENVVLGGVIPAGTGSQEILCQIKIESNIKYNSQKNYKFIFNNNIEKKNINIKKNILLLNKKLIHKYLKLLSSYHSNTNNNFINY
uniref:DNA-directed RNA polymerase subunit beta'' n=1 Tax=Coleochaete scutata TaxID=3125 RepID=A0A191T5N6_COLSC|nr:beta'' subunit of RNA polymerase [Coleochaete scutata]ANI25710.1 beta'' subunit of RNA polymerase [Coleochaete scutata]